MDSFRNGNFVIFIALPVVLFAYDRLVKHFCPSRFSSRRRLFNDDGILECPQWIADKLGVRARDVATLEISNSTKDVNSYTLLIEYLAHVAIDVHKSIDPVAENPDSSRLLSTLWTGPSAECIEKDEALAAKYHLGLGFARVRAGEEDVIIAHVARGNPIQVGQQSTIYRTVVLFAKHIGTTKVVFADAFAWEKRTRIIYQRAGTGKHLLWSLSPQYNTANWKGHGEKYARPLKSIFLPRNMLNEIVSDAQDFLKDSTKQWYLLHGLTYRRSYCFYGPPGVGKTSMISALAGELKLSVCFLGLSTTKLENVHLQSGFEKAAKPSIVVLEDIDCLFNKDRQALTDSPLTFSGLLNTLDGILSPENLLIVMTTNDMDSLDYALKRAGRVDRCWEFTEPNRDQVMRLFESFYPNQKVYAKTFVDNVFKQNEKSVRSIATLQQHFVYCREKSAKACVELLPEFIKKFFPDGDVGRAGSLFS